MYVCNPIYGIVVPLLFIQPNYQDKHIGSALLDMLQKLTWNILHKTCIFVWFKDNQNSEPLSFSSWFHPAHSTSFLFEHTFLSIIMSAINCIDSSEYCLEQNKINHNKNMILSNIIHHTTVKFVDTFHQWV